MKIKINWRKLVYGMLLDAFFVTHRFSGGKNRAARTETGARQVRAEEKIFQSVGKIISQTDLPVRFEAEDHRLLDLSPEPKFMVRMDLIDGTCGYARNQRIIGEPITAVIAIAPILQNRNLKFDDVIAGGVIDLRNGERWIAVKEDGSYAGAINARDKKFKTNIQYNRHSPVHTADFLRRINGLTRLLWPQSPEVWNSGSSAMDMILVALGEADIFYNGLPGVSNEGQRGHELGACYRILKEAGGYAIDMRTGEELGCSSFLFNEQTPVVMGVNKEKAEEFWIKIQQNFSKLDNALRAGEIRSLQDFYNLISPRQGLRDKEEVI